MAQLIKIAVDGMGGDNAPGAVVEGAVAAVREDERIFVYLVGKQELLNAELEKYDYPGERLEVVPASEVIGMGDAPVMAIRRKKDSSMVIAMNLVKEGKADAFVSAGSTGAILAGGTVLVGREKGVLRTPLAPLLPTKEGVTLLIDCGANVDAKSDQLVQFAQMGSIYMEYIVGVKNPTVALVNIGAEEEKGNALVKETYPLLKSCKNINFIGNIEARDIPLGGADVVVCDAFVGNVILKLYEGMGKTLISMLKKGMMESFRSKLGALLVKPALKNTMKKFDSSQYGGAPLLGCKGLLVKCHGSSSALEIKTSIIQCIAFREEKVNEKICAHLMDGENAGDDESE